MACTSARPGGAHRPDLLGRRSNRSGPWRATRSSKVTEHHVAAPGGRATKPPPVRPRVADRRGAGRPGWPFERTGHVAPGGFWIIVWIRRPGLASTQDVPSRLQISEGPSAKPCRTMPSSPASRRPVAAVVPNPRSQLGPTTTGSNANRGLPPIARSFRIESSEGRLATMHDGPSSQPASTIGQVVDQLQQRIDAAPPQVHRRTFITTYQRTTQAVGDAVDAAFFEDPDWVVRWMSLSRTCSSWRMTPTRWAATCRDRGGWRSGPIRAASSHRPPAPGHERAHQL